MQLALKSVQASDETTLLDVDSDKSNIGTADQSSVAPSSTANVSVASGSGAGFMNETAMIDSIHLDDNTRTTSTKNFKTLSGLTRPINKDVLSNNRYQQVRNISNSCMVFIIILHLYCCIVYVSQATQELKRPTLGALGNSEPGRQTEIFGGFSKEQVQANCSSEQ